MFPSGGNFNHIRRNGVRDEATLIRVLLDHFARLYADYVECLRNFHSQYDELIRNGSIPLDTHERQLLAIEGLHHRIQRLMSVLRARSLQ